MNASIETIQFVGACIGYTVSAVTLIALIVKPIRTKVVNWIKGINNTDDTSENIKKIEETQRQQGQLLSLIADGAQAGLRNDILQLTNTCLRQGYITTTNRMNLKDMYTAYHNLGGDTYATEIYNLALMLPIEEVNSND